MMLKVLFWALLATCLLGWWLPPVNAGLRYTTILLLVGYTGNAALLALRNTVYRRAAIVCAGGSIGLVVAPAWLIPVMAMPVILLTGAYLYVGARLLGHYLEHGRLPPLRDNPFEGNEHRDAQPDDTPAARPRQQHGRQMEPDLDTESLTFDPTRPPHER